MRGASAQNGYLSPLHQLRAMLLPTPPDEQESPSLLNIDRRGKSLGIASCRGWPRLPAFSGPRGLGSD